MDAGAAAILGVFAFIAVSAWVSSQREQREMQYRYELYQRMVEHPGPVADEVRALLERDAERDAERRRAAEVTGRRTGGAVMIAFGIGLGIVLYFLVPGKLVYLVALVPGLVGVALLIAGLRAQSEVPRGNSGGAR